MLSLTGKLIFKFCEPENCYHRVISIALPTNSLPLLLLLDVEFLRGSFALREGIAAKQVC